MVIFHFLFQLWDISQIKHIVLNVEKGIDIFLFERDYEVYCIHFNLYLEKLKYISIYISEKFEYISIYMSETVENIFRFIFQKSLKWFGGILTIQMDLFGCIKRSR